MLMEALSSTQVVVTRPPSRVGSEIHAGVAEIWGIAAATLVSELPPPVEAHPVARVKKQPSVVRVRKSFMM
jgi:hypothetical protein